MIEQSSLLRSNRDCSDKYLNLSKPEMLRVISVALSRAAGIKWTSQEEINYYVIDPFREIRMGNDADPC